jgi:shikimate dehydrogenase
MKYAIIGDPVAHSLSPVMHEAGYEALGLAAEYHRIPVRISEIEQGLEFLKANRYAGWNVTYPLKEVILPFLDEVTPEALRSGAVNTVKRLDDGRLLGHNTDGEGFILSLETKGYGPDGKKTVILGAGGAAKAIAVALAKKKTEMLILNRDQEKAKKLAEQVSGLGGNTAWGTLQAGDWLKEADLLIQSTPLGMQGQAYAFDLKGINPAALVVDLIYNPPVTPFMADAARNGCMTMNGLAMLLYQGVLAWKFWLNIDAPVKSMRRALEKSVGSLRPR